MEYNPSIREQPIRGELNSLANSVNNISNSQISIPWVDWTPSFTNMSAAPTFTYCRYTQIGKIVFISWLGNANGTVNSTAVITISNLPVAPKYRFNDLYKNVFYSAAYKGCHVDVAAGSTTMTFYQPGSTWIDNEANPFSGGWGTGLTWGFANQVWSFWYEVV